MKKPNEEKKHNRSDGHMSSTGFHQNFNLFFDGLGLARQNVDRTEQMMLRSPIGEGSIRRFVPRPDMEVVISDYTFHDKHAMSFAPKEAMVELSYCFQGAREVSLQGIRQEIVSGTCTLQFMKQEQTRFEFMGKQPFFMLGVGIPVSSFHHFMEEADGTRSVTFSDILGKRSFRAFQETIDPPSSIILNRLMKLINTPSTKNFEIECSIMEILSAAFRSFLLDGNSESTQLTKNEMEKIRHARAIMLECMAEPPTLIELSRMIGLNDYKLKNGFKEMYGTTVFGYLRHKRMETALLLLQGGKMNVNEVSCAVGYSNPSYFAEAFRERYGVNPSEFVRRSVSSSR